eukprot:s1186_g2.t1
MPATFVDIPRVGEEIWRTYFPSGFMETEMLEGIHFVEINDAKHGCYLYKHLRVSEQDVAYRLFWDIYDALEFNSEIYTILRHLKMNLAQNFAELANDRAMSLGYSIATQVEVVVLELSQDHCTTDSRNENTENTPCFDIGNTMLSEGVPPSRPVYLRSAKTNTEINGRVLDSIYSLVTRDMLVNSSMYFHNNIIWSAVEFLLAADAISVIGPSSSMFSSLMLLARRRLDKSAFHYDGEMTLLEAEGILRPAKSTAVELLRHPIKWVFSLGKSQKPSMSWNMSLAAVKSARMADVVPVCLTDAGPDSELVQVLLKMGVRVLHHMPKWDEKSKVVLNQWRAKSERKWVFSFPKFADIRGMLMRIDIPIVGLLDRFVLYTDIDIIFQRAVNWETMLRNSTPLLFTERNITYAKPGTVGLPQFFAMSAELVQSSDREKMDTGVMLMNLVNLRKTHQDFVHFLFDDNNKTWRYSTSDPVRYKAYYRRKGKIVATLLPDTMNWKVFWDWDPSKKSDSDHSDPTIVHFHGPKCETGIQPFLSEGIVHHESFRSLLEQCISLDSKCFRYCREYEWLLFEAYKQTNLDPSRSVTQRNLQMPAHDIVHKLDWNHLDTIAPMLHAAQAAVERHRAETSLSAEAIILGPQRSADPQTAAAVVRHHSMQPVADVAIRGYRLLTTTDLQLLRQELWSERIFHIIEHQTYHQLANEQEACRFLAKGCRLCTCAYEFALHRESLLALRKSVQDSRHTNVRCGPRCDICLALFPDVAALTQHVQTEHRLAGLSFNIARDSIDSQAACGALCGTVRTSLAGLRRHITGGHCKFFNPQAAAEACSRAADLVHHLVTAHSRLWRQAQPLTALLTEVVVAKGTCVCNPTINALRSGHICVPLRQVAMIYCRIGQVPFMPVPITDTALQVMLSSTLPREIRFLMSHLFASRSFHDLWTRPEVLQKLRSECMLCGQAYPTALLCRHLSEAHCSGHSDGDLWVPSTVLRQEPSTAAESTPAEEAPHKRPRVSRRRSVSQQGSTAPADDENDSATGPQARAQLELAAKPRLFCPVLPAGTSRSLAQGMAKETQHWQEQRQQSPSTMTMPLRQHLVCWLLRELAARIKAVAESKQAEELHQKCLARKLILEDMSFPYLKWDANSKSLQVDQKKKLVQMSKIMQHVEELKEGFRDSTLVVRFQGLPTSSQTATFPWKLQLNLRTQRPYELLLALTHSAVWLLLGTSLKVHATTPSTLAKNLFAAPASSQGLWQGQDEITAVPEVRDLTFEDLQSLRRLASGLTLSNPSTWCYANTTLYGILWALLNQNTISKRFWGVHFGQLSQFLQRSDGATQHLEKELWFQELFECWGQAQAQQDCAEFVHTFLQWLSTTAIDMRWACRVEHEKQISTVDTSSASMPVFLQFTEELALHDACAFDQLLLAWQQAFGMQTAMLRTLRFAMENPRRLNNLSHIDHKSIGAKAGAALSCVKQWTMGALYQALGVAPSASKRTIRLAYLRLAKQLHPDVNKASGAEANFQKVREAYEVLSDDDRRRAYDRQLSPRSPRTYGNGARTWRGAQGRGDFQSVDEEARRVRQEHEELRRRAAAQFFVRCNYRGLSTPAFFPVPLMLSHQFNRMPAGLSSKRRKLVHLHRAIHTICMALNFWFHDGKWVGDEDLQREPNAEHVALFRRLAALVRSDGWAESFTLSKSGRKHPELIARLGELSNLLTAHGGGSCAYEKGYPGIEIQQHDSVPELTPFKDLDADRLQVFGCGRWDVIGLPSDDLILAYREPSPCKFGHWVHPNVGILPLKWQNWRSYGMITTCCACTIAIGRLGLW